MINIEYSERTIRVQPYGSVSSNRYVIVAYSHYSNRTISVRHVATKYSDRKSFICTESPYSIRTFWMQSARLLLSSNRHCAFAGAASSNERTCMYKVGAKILMVTASISLSFTYTSIRKIFLNQDIIDQRTIMLCLPILSERYTFVERMRKAYIFSSVTFSRLTYNSERIVYLQLRDTYDTRYIGLLYSTYSDRKLLCSVARSAIVHTPLARMTLTNLHSDRHISLKVEVTHSERPIMLTLTPSSERYILTSIRIASERYIHMMLYAAYAVQTTQIMQARPERSERVCMFKTIVYSDSRKVFLEMREIYISRNISSLASTSPIILTGSNANIAITTDRQLTVYGDLVKQQESFNSSTSNKIVFSTTENTYTVSMLDYTGASLTVNGPVRKKILLSANIFYAEIAIT